MEVLLSSLSRLAQFLGAFSLNIVLGDGYSGSSEENPPGLLSYTNPYISSGPICAVSTAMLLLFWPKAEDTISPSRRRWQSFDLLGSILVISSCVLIVFAFQNVGVSFRSIWGEAVFVAPVAIGLVSILCLFSWTYLVEFGALSHHKIIAAFPLSLFKSRSYTSGVITTLLLGFPVLLTLFSVPLRAQIVSEKDPLTASLALLPMLGASAVGCVLAVLFNFRKAFPCESMTAGAILSVVGCALLTTVHSSDDDTRLLAYLAVLGLGTGLAVTVATLQTALVIPPRNHGMEALCQISGVRLCYLVGLTFRSPSTRNCITSPSSRGQFWHCHVVGSFAQRNHASDCWATHSRIGIPAWRS